MQIPGKADPKIYPLMREKALTFHRELMPKSATGNPHAPHVILMDWHVTNGTCTVMAAADGTASLYLSSGGGFIGGSQSSPAIRQAALDAIAIAPRMVPLAQLAKDHALPPVGEVRFYLVNVYGVYVASALEANFKAGRDPLLPLGAAMQKIVTQYRLWADARKKS